VNKLVKPLLVQSTRQCEQKADTKKNKESTVKSLANLFTNSGNHVGHAPNTNIPAQLNDPILPEHLGQQS
jgi:hypothetical protein